jgi:hypothetical protein
MLADMYKMKTKDLLQPLCQHLDTVMGDDENYFSYTVTQNKVQQLLQKWNASVLLSMPTLVQLGYHGRNSTTPAHRTSMDSNASMSSWGVDEDKYKERQQVEATVRQETLIVQKSLADDDTDEYATADKAEAAVTFEFVMQPPPQVANDSDKESENAPMDKEDDKESLDDLDKKPKAKPAPSKKESPPKKLSPQAQNQEKPRSQNDDSITNPEPPAKPAVARLSGTRVPFVIEWSSESKNEGKRTEVSQEMRSQG